MEWSLVALILLGLAFAFEREIRSLQNQSERVFVWSTLASLRTALVLNRLARQVRPDDASLIEKNPFRLLQQLPANYAGEMPMQDVYLVPPGSWLFDPDCPCVGYRLLYPEWLEPAQEIGVIWFRIGRAGDGPSLSPLEDYLWQGIRFK
ncbi:MAG: hypothetical protein V4858_10080 [Pseudomonadota bacterium]